MTTQSILAISQAARQMSMKARLAANPELVAEIREQVTAELRDTIRAEVMAELSAATEKETTTTTTTTKAKAKAKK